MNENDLNRRVAGFDNMGPRGDAQSIASQSVQAALTTMGLPGRNGPSAGDMAEVRQYGMPPSLVNPGGMGGALQYTPRAGAMGTPGEGRTPDSSFSYDPSSWQAQARGMMQGPYGGPWSGGYPQIGNFPSVGPQPQGQDPMVSALQQGNIAFRPNYGGALQYMNPVTQGAANQTPGFWGQMGEGIAQAGSALGRGAGDAWTGFSNGLVWGNGWKTPNASDANKVGQIVGMGIRQAGSDMLGRMGAGPNMFTPITGQGLDPRDYQAQQPRPPREPDGPPRALHEQNQVDQWETQQNAGAYLNSAQPGPVNSYAGRQPPQAPQAPQTPWAPHYPANGLYPTAPVQPPAAPFKDAVPGVPTPMDIQAAQRAQSAPASGSSGGVAEAQRVWDSTTPAPAAGGWFSRNPIPNLTAVASGAWDDMTAPGAGATGFLGHGVRGLLAAIPAAGADVTNLAAQSGQPLYRAAATAWTGETPAQRDFVGLGLGRGPSGSPDASPSPVATPQKPAAAASQPAAGAPATPGKTQQQMLDEQEAGMAGMAPSPSKYYNPSFADGNTPAWAQGPYGTHVPEGVRGLKEINVPESNGYQIMRGTQTVLSTPKEMARGAGPTTEIPYFTGGWPGGAQGGGAQTDGAPAGGGSAAEQARYNEGMANQERMQQYLNTPATAGMNRGGGTGGGDIRTPDDKRPTPLTPFQILDMRQLADWDKPVHGKGSPWYNPAEWQAWAAQKATTNDYINQYQAAANGFSPHGGMKDQLEAMKILQQGQYQNAQLANSARGLDLQQANIAGDQDYRNRSLGLQTQNAADARAQHATNNAFNQAQLDETTRYHMDASRRANQELVANKGKQFLAQWAELYPNQDYNDPKNKARATAVWNMIDQGFNAAPAAGSGSAINDPFAGRK